jgi:hypothetical protein
VIIYFFIVTAFAMIIFENGIYLFNLLFLVSFMTVLFRMDEVAQKLNEEWKTRHFESSEEAFAKADEGFVRESGPSFFQKGKETKTVLAARKSKK